MKAARNFIVALKSIPNAKFEIASYDLYQNEYQDDFDNISAEDAKKRYCELITVNKALTDLLEAFPEINVVEHVNRKGGNA